MSDAPKAEILNLSVEGGTLLYETRVTGPDDLKVDMVFVVYDASGIERWRQEYAWGSDPFARAMNTQIEWPPGTFTDNEDHGAWLYLNLSDANGNHIAQETKGVAFTVGRGVAFQSSEQLPDLQTKEFSSVVIENCRLEGTWAVYDMRNTANHDLEVTHYLQLSTDSGEEIDTPSAQELVRAGAVQQAHHLLPDPLANGRYYLLPSVEVHGTGVAWPYNAITIEVDNGVITML